MQADANCSEKKPAICKWQGCVEDAWLFIEATIKNRTDDFTFTIHRAFINISLTAMKRKQNRQTTYLFSPSIPNLLLLLSTTAVVFTLLSSFPISNSVLPFWKGEDDLLSVVNLLVTSRLSLAANWWWCSPLVTTRTSFCTTTAADVLLSPPHSENCWVSTTSPPPPILLLLVVVETTTGCCCLLVAVGLFPSVVVVVNEVT